MNIRDLYKYEFFFFLPLLHTLSKENVCTVLIWDSKYLINCCSWIFVQRFHYLLFVVSFLQYIKYFVMKTYDKPVIGTPCRWHFIPLLYRVLCWQKKSFNSLFQVFVYIPHKLTLQIWSIKRYDHLVKTTHKNMHVCVSVSVRHLWRSPILWDFSPIHHHPRLNLISLHFLCCRNTVNFSAHTIM